MPRYQQRKGKIGENITFRILRTMGFRFIRPVGKHVHLTPIDPKRGTYRVNFISKLAGDFTAVGDGGQSVLVEVKHIDQRDTLRWSDLRKGQPESLTEHAEAGGLSLSGRRNWICNDEETFFL